MRDNRSVILVRSFEKRWAVNKKDELTEVPVMEAGEVLDRTPRAIIAQIQAGKLKGEKRFEDGRTKWFVQIPTSLLTTYRENQAEKQKVATSQKSNSSSSESSGRGSYKQYASHKRESESAIDTPQRGEKKKYEDFRDLRAYGELHKLFDQLEKEKTFDENLRQLFLIALEKLAMGFYEFDKTRKANIYSEARGTLARILNRLVLLPKFDKALTKDIFTRINGEIMGSVIAIIRRAEGSWGKKKKRYDDDEVES